MRTPRIHNCQSCKLADVRRSIVVGRGQIPAQVLFLGEAPGQTEDITSIPFFGQSGKMLDRIIDEAEVKFSYYITNAVLCHPTDKVGGQNREPSEDEVFSCMDNVVRLHDAVDPLLTIFVGKIAEKYYRKVFKPNATILHPSFIIRTGGRGSPFYFMTVRKLKEVIQCFVG